MSRGRTMTRFSQAPKSKPRHEKLNQKFQQAHNEHEAEVHVSYKRRAGQTFARNSISQQSETVLEFKTRKRW